MREHTARKHNREILKLKTIVKDLQAKCQEYEKQIHCSVCMELFCLPSNSNQLVAQNAEQ